MSVCSKGAILVIESTVSPGTIDKYVKPIIKNNNFVLGEDINIVHAPERIIPGNMIYELKHNSRTLVLMILVSAIKSKNYIVLFAKEKLLLLT